MCTPNTVLLWLGLLTESGGLLLLGIGLDDLRKQLDPSYQGFGLWASAKVRLMWGRWIVHPLRKLFRRGGRDNVESIEASMDLIVSAGGRLSRVPNWRGDADERIREVFEILEERIEILRADSTQELGRLKEAIEQEAQSRITDDDAIRESLTETSLGGWGKETTALILVGVGLVLTFVGSVCV